MLKNFFLNKYFLFLLRIFLGFIFIYSGIEKISDAEGFSTSIYNYKLLPLFLINFMAVIIPWIELAAGFFLVFGVAVKENAFVINSLLLIFIIAIVISLARGLDISCGCFGTEGGTKVGFLKVVENSALFLAGMLLIFYDSTLLSLINRKIK